MAKMHRAGSVPFLVAEALLSRLHDIKSDCKGQVGTRIRHLARYGFPNGVNVGRGLALAYSLDQLLQLVAAFELIEAGIPPQRIIELIDRDWTGMRASVLSALRNFGSSDIAPVFWIVPMSALHEWRYPRKVRDSWLRPDEIVIASEREAHERAFSPELMAFRYAHIRADSLVHAVINSLLNAKDLSRAEIENEIGQMELAARSPVSTSLDEMTDG